MKTVFNDYFNYVMDTIHTNEIPITFQQFLDESGEKEKVFPPCYSYKYLTELKSQINIKKASSAFDSTYLVYVKMHETTYYGGSDNPLEVIKIIKHYNLDFWLGNVLKYVIRAGKKEDEIKDLEKAIWYLQDKIQCLKEKN